MAQGRQRRGIAWALILTIGLPAGLGVGWGCQPGEGVLPDDLIPPVDDTQTDTAAHPDEAAEPPEEDGGCPPSAMQTITMAGGHFGVLANRQKFIGLEAYKAGVEYDSFAFTITQGPAHGRLIGTAPNVAYVPDVDYTGPDSFSYEAKYVCTTLRRTIQLTVDTNYDPPLGIPSPEFGIVESHRMYASATFDFGLGPEPYHDAGNGPYTHYLNYQTGTDVGNPYGTADRPRKTFPADLPAGSVVEVHGSGFDSMGNILVRGNGTAAQPIFIRGANPLTKPVLRRALKVESDYVICENLEWDCRDFGTTSTEGVWLFFRERTTPLQTFHHMAARHILMRDCPANSLYGAAGIMADVSHVSGSPNTPTDLTQHVVIYDVEVRNFGVWNDFSGPTDYAGCGFAGNSRYGWLLDSHLHHIHGDATGVTRANALSDQAPARNIYLGRNYLHHCKENGIDVKLCIDGVISQNVVHTIRLSESSQGDAITIHNDDATTTWPYSDNIWVLFNKIYDAEYGITHKNRSDQLPAAADSRSYLIGNLLFDIRTIRGQGAQSSSAIFNGPRTQDRVINNTIYNCDRGIWVGLSIVDEPERCVTVVRNNIIANLTERVKSLTGFDATHIVVQPDSIDPYTTIDHNLHWEDVGEVRINIMRPGLQDANYSTIEALFAATGYGAGSMVADPMFVDVKGMNFHLQSGSPALGAGWPDDAYTIYFAQFGQSIDVHFDGTLLPNPPDIGPLGSQ